MNWNGIANGTSRGEEAARQAEERLNKLEKKIEELLASAEAAVEGKGGLGKEGLEEVGRELGGLEEDVKGEGKKE